MPSSPVAPAPDVTPSPGPTTPPDDIAAASVVPPVAGRGAAVAATTRLLGIGEAASRSGVSERALRYYQQLGLISPSGSTPGGLRRYSEQDLERVARLRELQDLLGLNLEEIRVVLTNDDRLAALRREYREEGTATARRRELVATGLEIRAELRATVETKLVALQHFLDDLDADRARLQGILDDDLGGPPASQDDGSDT